MTPDDSSPDQDTSTIATLQSLIVAFVLAMTFRGFVTEGFVIPTGSMAPTLMGEHLLLHSDLTGFTYPADAKGKAQASAVYDPMIGQNYPMNASHARTMRPRMGDRILVLKSLYPFADPDRFDVVVFKNPTAPDGDAENYIKRLVGLPNEAIWLVDGDVFVAPADDAGNLDAYKIQRKREYIQRSIWRPVHDINFIPVRRDSLPSRFASPWSGEGWDTSDVRSYRCETAEPTTLTWDNDQIPLTDWTPYNMFSLVLAGRMRDYRNLSDIRVSADVVAQEPGLSATMEIEARGHIFQFSIAGGHATVRYRSFVDASWIAEQSTAVDMPEAGAVYRIEFWHVDQSMTIMVNGTQIGETLRYDWTPRERLENTHGLDLDAWKRGFPNLDIPRPQLRWMFAGSPLTLTGMRVDRDLYYRTERLTSQALRNPTQDGFDTWVSPQSPGFGTHPEKPAILGPDHFFMLGDNSPASSDSRLWGNPHPLVAEQIDRSPFLVHRKLLLGKAWVVYFPALYPVSPNGRGVVPDFGRLRFIR